VNATLDPRPQVDFARNMGYNPTVDSAQVPAELHERIAFSEAMQKNFMVQDYEYLAANDAKLKDWWDKVFKA
jgi:putative spermidine/putrescine transport system substrate-binding protein